MKDMTPTNLRTANRYGITLEEIVDDFSVYGYKFHAKKHFEKSCYGRPVDFITMHSEDENDETDYQIEVTQGNCPECGEKCVAWGWGDGGYHSSTCSCGNIDFS